MRLNVEKWRGLQQGGIAVVKSNKHLAQSAPPMELETCFATINRAGDGTDSITICHHPPCLHPCHRNEASCPSACHWSYIAVAGPSVESAKVGEGWTSILMNIACGNQGEFNNRTCDSYSTIQKGGQGRQWESIRSLAAYGIMHLSPKR